MSAVQSDDVWSFNLGCLDSESVPYTHCNSVMVIVSQSCNSSVSMIWHRDIILLSTLQGNHTRSIERYVTPTMTSSELFMSFRQSQHSTTLMCDHSTNLPTISHQVISLDLSNCVWVWNFDDPRITSRGSVSIFGLFC